MKIKWQWFLGGRGMFWMASALLIIFVFIFATTYIVDPTACLYMKKQDVDEETIKEISDEYINSLGIKINKPINYRFVYFQNQGHFIKQDNENKRLVILGMFHEWNGSYYIDIAVSLYKMKMLDEVVIHETRHLIVQELRNQKIIDLTKYTEEIAEEINPYYNNLFDNGVNLLKEKEKDNG